MGETVNYTKTNFCEAFYDNVVAETSDINFMSDCVEVNYAENKMKLWNQERQNFEV